MAPELPDVERSHRGAGSASTIRNARRLAAMPLQRCECRRIGLARHADEVEDVDAVGDAAETEDLARQQGSVKVAVRCTGTRYQHGAVVAASQRSACHRLAWYWEEPHGHGDECRAAIDYAFRKARVGVAHREVLETLDHGVAIVVIEHFELEAGGVGRRAPRRADAKAVAPEARRGGGDCEIADGALKRDCTFGRAARCRRQRRRCRKNA